MTTVSTPDIAAIVRRVIAELHASPPPASPPAAPVSVAGHDHQGANGVFSTVDEAVAAASAAFERLERLGMEGRRRAIARIRASAIDDAEELGRMELAETRIGRLEHKVEKLRILGEKVPGVEFMTSEIFSGDRGLAVVEHAPFGVIGAITPVTHSLPTIACNAINMIAAGNAVVVNPHPSGRAVAAEGVRRFNAAIRRDIGVDNLVCVIDEPSLESAEALFQHRDVKLICVTGGPAVARAALRSSKRAIVAGPGNPPVVVDETADLERAAKSIVQGAAYDNNLLCIGEKQVFVVAAVFDKLAAAMERAGALRLNAGQVDALTRRALVMTGEGPQRHWSPCKDLLGQDAALLAKAAGAAGRDGLELLFGETDVNNPFVPTEQMMPFLPFVRCQDADEAIQRALESEHGFRHTAVVHSTNVRTMTRMGRLLDTTLFVKNGPSVAGLGLGGEGYLSFSIATPTGEGVTTPLTFTRQRRCTLVDDLRILGGVD